MVSSSKRQFTKEQTGAGKKLFDPKTSAFSKLGWLGKATCVLLPMGFVPLLFKDKDAKDFSLPYLLLAYKQKYWRAAHEFDQEPEAAKALRVEGALCLAIGLTAHTGVMLMPYLGIYVATAWLAFASAPTFLAAGIVAGASMGLMFCAFVLFSQFKRVEKSHKGVFHNPKLLRVPGQGNAKKRKRKVMEREAEAEEAKEESKDNAPAVVGPTNCTAQAVIISGASGPQHRKPPLPPGPPPKHLAGTGKPQPSLVKSSPSTRV